MNKTLLFLGVIALALFLLPPDVLASAGTGGELPYEGFLEGLRNSMTGPVAYTISPASRMRPVSRTNRTRPSTAIPVDSSVMIIGTAFCSHARALSAADSIFDTDGDAGTLSASADRPLPCSAAEPAPRTTAAARMRRKTMSWT